MKNPAAQQLGGRPKKTRRAKSRGTSVGKIAVDKLNSRHEAENVENKNKNKTEKIYENKIY